MDNAAAGRPQGDDARVFIEELVRTGLMLTDLLGRLLENLPENTFPGQDPVEALLEMTTGTIRPAADAAGARTVREATMLLGAVRDRVLSDLHAAVELARRA